MCFIKTKTATVIWVGGDVYKQRPVELKKKKTLIKKKKWSK